jgi:hypothetical protein
MLLQTGSIPLISPFPYVRMNVVSLVHEFTNQFSDKNKAHRLAAPDPSQRGQYRPRDVGGRAGLREAARHSRAATPLRVILNKAHQ